MKYTTIIFACALLSPLAFSTSPTIEPAHSASVHTPITNENARFLSGNGNLGIMMKGNPYTDFLIATGKFYLPMGNKEIMPDLSGYKDELKKLGLDAGQNGPAVVHRKILEITNQVLVNTDPLHPLFFLHANLPESPQYENYTMTQNFQTGELKATWSDDKGDWSRQAFVSRADEAIVLKISGPKGKLDCTLKLDINHPLIDTQQEITTSTMTAHNTYLKGKGGYDISLKIIPKGGKTEVLNDSLSISEADEVLIIAQAQRWRTPLTKEESEAWITSPENPIYTNNITDYRPILKNQVEKLPYDYDKLLARHIPKHQKLYNAISLNLNSGKESKESSESLLQKAIDEKKVSNALVERLYNACRYLIICSSGKTPPNLQGIWTNTWSPAWSGDYTLDSNIQQGVNSIMSSNMLELMESYFNLIESWIPDWRLNAQKVFGFRGVVSNARASDTCLLLHWGGEWPGEHAGIALAGWMLSYFYDYYLYTGDKDFLEKRFFPLAKEIALFYEDFLTGTENENGKYRFYMGYSPEHGLTANTTFDISSAKYTLTTLLQAAELLNYENNQDIQTWKSLLAKMPPYLINSKGQLQEWAWFGAGESPNQRHHSHLISLYQFHEFDREKTPELWKAAEQAHRLKEKHFLRNEINPDSSRITHGMMDQGECAAKLGRGDVIHNILTRMTVDNYVYPSFMISYWPKLNGYGFDPVGNTPGIINKSLLQSRNGILDILPALPEQWKQGSVKGMTLAGQLTVNELKWDMEKGNIYLEITSALDQKITLRLPEGITLKRNSSLSLKKGKPEKITLQVSPKEYQSIWKTQKELVKTLIPNPKWKVVSVSSVGWPAEGVIDNELNTFWHTHTGEGRQPAPQFVTIDTNEMQNINGFYYAPRNDDNTTGNVLAYTFEISKDGSTWEKIHEGRFKKEVKGKQNVRFDKTYTTRYFRFTATESMDDCVAVSELGVINP